MSQTSLIFFFLLAAFIVYAAVKGELPKYAKVFYG